MARLEKAKKPGVPVLPPEILGRCGRGAGAVGGEGAFTTNDYYVYRRPGEVMIVRWLEGEQVETYYERIQAHLDVALTDYKEEEKQTHGWKQDAKTLEYLNALDKLDVKMADRYLRDYVRKHGIFVLSTQTADEISIVYLCDYVMGVPPAEVVGDAAAPPDNPEESGPGVVLQAVRAAGGEGGGGADVFLCVPTEVGRELLTERSMARQA